MKKVDILVAEDEEQNIFQSEKRQGNSDRDNTRASNEFGAFHAPTNERIRTEHDFWYGLVKPAKRTVPENEHFQTIIYCLDTFSD